MCIACELSADRSHWADAGLVDGPEFAADHRERMRALAVALGAHGLKVRPGMQWSAAQVCTASGRFANARDLGEVWSAAEALLGRAIDPLDERFAGAGPSPRAPISEPERARTPLTIVGGLPGAGKTTWLGRQVRDGVFRGARVLFDGPAAGGLRRDEDDEAIARLRRACLPGGAQAKAAPRIVLETGGFADPNAIADSIRSDPALSQVVDVREVIVVVDAASGLVALREDALARRQVERADCLIVARLDVAGERDVVGVLNALERLNPLAPRFGAVRGLEQALPALDDAGFEEFGDREENHPGAEVFDGELDVGEVSWPVLSVWLSALLHARGDDVLRLQGAARARAGRLSIEVALGTVLQPEILPEPWGDGDGRFAVSGRGFTPEGLQRSLDAFVAATRRADVSPGTGASALRIRP